MGTFEYELVLDIKELFIFVELINDTIGIYDNVSC